MPATGTHATLPGVGRFADGSVRVVATAGPGLTGRSRSLSLAPPAAVRVRY